jgi:hypothetical protein
MVVNEIIKSNSIENNFIIPSNTLKTPKSDTTQTHPQTYLFSHCILLIIHEEHSPGFSKVIVLQ